jgi:hypothetical protein
MSDEITPDGLRHQLKEIDAELAELRGVTGDVQARRGEDGDSSEGYQERDDLAVRNTQAGESGAAWEIVVGACHCWAVTPLAGGGPR